MKDKTIEERAGKSWEKANRFFAPMGYSINPETYKLGYKEGSKEGVEDLLHDFTGFLMKRNITSRVRMDGNSMAQLVIDYLKSKE